MAQRALPPLFLLAAAVVFAVAAAPAHGQTIELGSRRWLEDMGAMAPAEGPAADAYGNDTPHISYGALSRDTVACSTRGESYYNCQDGAKGGEVNSYRRSCTAISRCRS